MIIVLRAKKTQERDDLLSSFTEIMENKRTCFDLIKIDLRDPEQDITFKEEISDLYENLRINLPPLTFWKDQQPKVFQNFYVFKFEKCMKNPESLKFIKVKRRVSSKALLSVNFDKFLTESQKQNQKPYTVTINKQDKEDIEGFISKKEVIESDSDTDSDNSEEHSIHNYDQKDNAESIRKSVNLRKMSFFNRQHLGPHTNVRKSIFGPRTDIKENQVFFPRKSIRQKGLELDKLNFSIVSKKDI